MIVMDTQGMQDNHNTMMVISARCRDELTMEIFILLLQLLITSTQIIVI